MSRKPDQRHVERARDGRRRKRQNIDVVLQLFQAFLVRHAEALFFVHDQQAEVVKLDVARKQPVRADDDVHFARFHFRQDVLLLARGAKPAEHVDLYGERRKAPAKCLEMLECQHGRGREHGDLLRIGDRFERRAHGHFRLAVTHVAAKQAVHGLRALHVALHVRDGDGLVGRFVKFKGIFKFTLERAVRRKCEALPGLPFGIEFQQFVGHVLDRLADASLARRPGCAAELVEGGLRSFDGPIALHQIEPFERHIQARVVRVAQAHELAAGAAIFNLVQSLKLADSVIHVHDVIPGLQLRKIAEKTAGLGPPPRRRARRHRFKQIPGSVDRQAGVQKNDAIGERRAAQNDRGNAAGRGIFRQARAGGDFLQSRPGGKEFHIHGRDRRTARVRQDFRPPAGRALRRRCARALRP